MVNEEAHRVLSILAESCAREAVREFAKTAHDLGLAVDYWRARVPPDDVIGGDEIEYIERAPQT